ncbi:hypothetical protein H4C48_25955 [Pseudomonas asiatica]|uniref:hypothetical protein n=1 Tax=Pseudomonas asiatica TaxID=2219225 RepID=UPI0015FBA769|nr:hypothetical protein [Pseudomonas asiatica]MBA6113809.1 hypothetical protein [Pseudomonas asiatica]
MAKAQPNRVKAETLSLRISPDLKYGLELISRIEENSLTSQVEKALRELFATARMSYEYLGESERPSEIPNHEIYFSEILQLVMSIDAPTRLLRTAILLPYTLNQKDQAILELIHTQPEFDGEDSNVFGFEHEHSLMTDWLTKEYFSKYSKVSLKAIRKNWARLNEAADQTLEMGHYPAEMVWES